MKITSLTNKHIEAGARMTEFAGYNMPLEYSGIISEHMAVRNRVGIFDASHMGEVIISGKHALDLIQYVSSNDAGSLSDGQAQYSCLPNGRGGIVDDIIVFRYGSEKYMVVVNASNIEKDLEWIKNNNSFGAHIDDISDDISLIALQGPKAVNVINKLSSTDLSELKSFTFIQTDVAGFDNITVSATGYTGAGGFEIYCNNEVAPIIWDKLLESGREFDIQPAGLASRDTLRLEMGYCLYGNDISDLTSPIEAGLGWIVKTGKSNNFIDKELLKEQKEKGVTKKLVGFELLDKGIPRKDYPVLNDNNENIGSVTSGTMSPVLKKGVGMGYIQTEYSQPGTDICISVRNKFLKARVVKPPFI